MLMRHLAPFLLSCLVAFSATADNWPAWRGDIAGSGITKQKNLPTKWSKTENVAWRTELPNRGNSTPVVWGDKVFVTQVVEANDFRSTMCFSLKNGELLWQNGVTFSEEESTHRTNPYCSASPAIDGERVIVTYGSAGVHCYDLDGKDLWKQDLGPQKHTWGNASSPVLFEDLCILYHGPGPHARMVAMDKKTGKIRWDWKEPAWDTTGRTDGFKGKDNDGVIGSFSTPIIVNTGKRHELIMSFPQEIKSFDPKTSDVLWTSKGLNPLVYTSPIFDNGILTAMGGYHGNSMAIKIKGNESGDITKNARLWHEVRGKGGIGTGVSHKGHIYFLTSSGIASCLNAKTGKVIWEERVGKGNRGSSSWSSFLLAGDVIYSVHQSGDVTLFKASPEFQQIGVNSVGEQTNSSLVPVNGGVILRTHEALWLFKG